jgi:hypothetical protein
MNDINVILDDIEQDEDLQMRICDLAGELNEILSYNYSRTYDWGTTLKELYKNLQGKFDDVALY